MLFGITIQGWPNVNSLHLRIVDTTNQTNENWKYLRENKVVYKIWCHTVGQDCQKCKETSNLEVICHWINNKKGGEYVENIKFRRVSKLREIDFPAKPLYFKGLKLMFSTFSTLFYCLSSRGPDVRKVKKQYIVISVKS